MKCCYIRRAIFTYNVMIVTLVLSGCATLPQSGPSTAGIKNAQNAKISGGSVAVIDVSDGVAARLKALDKPALFTDRLTSAKINGSIIGRGDTLEIGIWEAPPAVLFGAPMPTSAAAIAASSSSASTTKATNLPLQMVGADGNIQVPFAGSVPAAGRTTQQIAQDIKARLRGKAHDPEVLVSLALNAATDVTIVGDVTKSQRMPLTSKGERILDALASAGGVKQPVDKMTLQITRGEQVIAMPLAQVIRDPRQNVPLQAGDVVTALFQPYSFTVLALQGKTGSFPLRERDLRLARLWAAWADFRTSAQIPEECLFFDLRTQIFSPTSTERPWRPQQTVKSR